jgi:hypothetical protein
MGRHAKLTLRRGDEVIAVHDDALCQQVLSRDKQASADSFDGCIGRLHKAALSRLEVAAGGRKFTGCGQAAGTLRTRFCAEDKSVLKGIRALGEAFAFCRHLTSVGESLWLANLDRALGRLGDVVAPAAVVALEVLDAGGGGMNVDGGKKGKKKKKKKGKKDESVDLAVSVPGPPLVTTPNPTLTPDGVVGGNGVVLALAPSALDSPGASGITTRRQLAAQTSRERSPHRSGGASRSDGLSFTAGARVTFVGLHSRPELRGVTATVLSFDSASGRFAVALDNATNEKIKVLPANLKASIFS